MYPHLLPEANRNVNNNRRKRERTKGLLEASLTSWSQVRGFHDYHDRPVAKVSGGLKDREYRIERNEKTGRKQVVVPISYWQNAYEAIYANGFVYRRDSRVILAVHSPVETIGAIKSKLFQADFYGHSGTDWKPIRFLGCWCLVALGGQYRRPHVNYYGPNDHDKAVEFAEELSHKALETAILQQTGHLPMDVPF